MDRSPCADQEPLPLEDLLLRGRSGDRQALAGLIRRYQGRVARFVIGQTGDESHCEDVCQTVFVKMVLALPGLRAADRFEPWLFQIARNACRDHLRARQGWRRLFVSAEPEHEAIAAEMPGAGRGRELERGLAQLPPEQQNLLRLSIEEKRSYEELARLTNSSVSSVKSRLYRARENLRGFLLAGDSE
jgi:RNA polymerase sigma-70 factor, ECF subfamily